MQTKLTILSLLISLSIATKAQWVSYGPQNGHINALAVYGQTVFAGSDDNGIYLFHNNNKNWSEANTVIFSRLAVYTIVTRDSNIFAGTAIGVYLSSDSGTNWTKRSNGLPINGEVNSLAINGNNIYAGTPDGLYISNDNGSHWSIINAGLPLYPDIHSFALNGNTIFMGTINKGAFLSTNNGSSWSAINNGLPPDNFSGIRVTALAISGNYIFAGISAKGVYLSTNNGASWSVVNNGLPIGTTVFAFLVDGNNLFAGTDNGVYLSTNKGNSWEALPNRNSQLSNTWVKALTKNDSNVFAGTQYIGVWQMPLSELPLTINENRSLEKGDLNIYPNPVINGILNISYSKPLNQINIYNLLGQVVLRSKAVNTVNVSDLEKGIYIIVIDDKEDKIIRKVVIE